MQFHVHQNSHVALKLLKIIDVTGSCWAFSTVVAVEGINKIKTGELVNLSEQELVDCDKENQGCDGGLMEQAFEFIKQSDGLTTENSYPYKAKDESCDSSKVKRKTLNSISMQIW